MKEKEMSLRDYFAAKALQGILANPEIEKWEQIHEKENGIYLQALAKTVYKIADALIKEMYK